MQLNGERGEKNEFHLKTVILQFLKSAFILRDLRIRLSGLNGEPSVINCIVKVRFTNLSYLHVLQMCVYVYVYVCMYVCIYVCMYVLMYDYIYVLFVCRGKYIALVRGIKSFLASHVWFQAVAGARTYGTDLPAITSQLR